MTRLIVVEDDPYFIALVHSAVQPLGFQVESCTSIAGAMQALARPADILVVDGVLPDGTGDKLVERVLSMSHTRPRIAFVSAFFKDRNSVHRLRSLGVDVILHKPVTAACLQAELAALLPPTAYGVAQANASVPAMRELVQAFTESFLRRRAELLKGLVAAEYSHDLGPLVGCCHKLAGTAGSYGYEAMSQAASRVESAAEAGAPFEQISNLTHRLLAMLEGANEHVRNVSAVAKADGGHLRPPPRYRPNARTAEKRTPALREERVPVLILSPPVRVA